MTVTLSDKLKAELEIALADRVTALELIAAIENGGGGGSGSLPAHFGKTWYVDSSISESGDGTAWAPFKTLAEANAEAQPFDTVIVNYNLTDLDLVMLPMVVYNLGTFQNSIASITLSGEGGGGAFWIIQGSSCLLSADWETCSIGDSKQFVMFNSLLVSFMGVSHDIFEMAGGQFVGLNSGISTNSNVSIWKAATGETDSGIQLVGACALNGTSNYNTGDAVAIDFSAAGGGGVQVMTGSAVQNNSATHATVDAMNADLVIDGGIFNAGSGVCLNLSQDGAGTPSVGVNSSAQITTQGSVALIKEAEVIVGLSPVFNASLTIPAGDANIGKTLGSAYVYLSSAPSNEKAMPGTIAVVLPGGDEYVATSYNTWQKIGV